MFVRERLLGLVGNRGIGALASETAGSASAWGLVWFVGLLSLAGVAVDASDAWRMRAMLQSSSDAAAHAGAVSLIDRTIAENVLAEHAELTGLDVEDPKDVAIAFAQLNMPPELHGTVLRRDEVTLGRWSGEERRFVANAIDPNAVLVRLRRAAENSNSLPTNILSIIGFDAWDIDVFSISRIYKDERAECVDPLLAAQARVDVQSNDVYVGICVYADADIWVDTSTPWLSNEVVGFVDRVVLSGADSLTLAALEGGTTNLPEHGLGETLSAATFSGAIEELRASATTELTIEQFENAALTSGATYYVSCADGQTLGLPGTRDLSRVVILSECPVRAAQDLSLRSTVVIANLAALRHIEISIDTQDLLPPRPELFGNEPCVPGDGVQIIVFVDFDTAARFTLFDPEVFPLGEAMVAAHRNDTEVDADAMVHVGATAEGNVLTNVGLQNLLGLCVASQFLLNVDAVTMAN